MAVIASEACEHNRLDVTSLPPARLASSKGVAQVSIYSDALTARSLSHIVLDRSASSKDTKLQPPI